MINTIKKEKRNGVCIVITYFPPTQLSIYISKTKGLERIAQPFF